MQQESKMTDYEEELSSNLYLLERGTTAEEAPLSETFVYEEAPWLAGIDPDRAFLRRLAYIYTKRIKDLFLIGIFSPLLVPLCLVCAVAIKLESPRLGVFFVQKRTGKDGRRFRMYKFRTMVPQAEIDKENLRHLNDLSWPDFKMTDDPRVTRVGRMLRRLAFDELPQLFNVLRGEMTLVGPRPTSFGAETYTEWHLQRLDVVPGMTGLWQILRRGSTEFNRRVHYDLTYIRHQCIWLDVQILLRTVHAVLVNRGPY